MSDDDEVAADAAEIPDFFTSTSQAVAVAEPEVERTPSFHEILERAAAPARPQFAELAEEPAYATLPRDYAPELENATRTPAAVDEYPAEPTALFAEAEEPAQRDLDTPAFLRRLRF
jgi:hypothetical protein